MENKKNAASDIKVKKLFFTSKQANDVEVFKELLKKGETAAGIEFIGTFDEATSFVNKLTESTLKIEGGEIISGKNFKGNQSLEVNDQEPKNSPTIKLLDDGVSGLFINDNGFKFSFEVLPEDAFKTKIMDDKGK